MLTTLFVLKVVSVLGVAGKAFDFVNKLLGRVTELEKLVQDLKALSHKH